MSIAHFYKGDRAVLVDSETGSWVSVPRSECADAISVLARTRRPTLAKGLVDLPIIVPIRNGACNLLCRYCYIMPEQERATRLEAEDHHVFIREVARLAQERRIIVVLIGGEPLLNFAVIRQVVEEWDRRKAMGDNLARRVEFGIFSNLTLLTHKMAQWIRDHNVRICTSLDGPADLHDSFRVDRQGRGSFQATLDGLHLLKSLGVEVGVATTVTNPDRVEETFEFLVSLGIRRTNLRHARPQMNNVDRKAFECSAEYEEETAAGMLAVADRIIRNNQSGRETLSDFSIGVRALHLVYADNPYMCLRSPCGAGSGTKIGLDCDGRIYPCDTMAGMQALSIGNLREIKTGISLDHMLKASVVMRTVRSRTTEHISKCRHCTWKRFCGGGCTAASYSLYRRLDMAADRCRYEAKMFEGLLWRLTASPRNFALLTRPLGTTPKIEAIG